jgi:hypothetical protein
MNDHLHAPAGYTQGKGPFTLWIGGWLGLSVDMDDNDKWQFLTLLRLELRPLNSSTSLQHISAGLLGKRKSQPTQRSIETLAT